MADINVNIRTTAAQAEKETRSLTSSLVLLSGTIGVSRAAIDIYNNRQTLTAKRANDLAKQLTATGRSAGANRVFFNAGAAALELYSTGISTVSRGITYLGRNYEDLYFRLISGRTALFIHRRAMDESTRAARRASLQFATTRTNVKAYQDSVDILTFAKVALRIQSRKLADTFSGGLIPGLRSVGTRAVSLLGTVGKLTLAFKLAPIAIGAFVAVMAAATLGAVALVNKLNQVEIAARRLGTTTDYIQQISFAASQAGTSLATLQSIAATADLSAFGSGFQEQIRNIADHLASYSTHSERAAEATRIFGRRGLELLPLLEGGSTALNDYAQQFENTGNRIDEQSVRTAQRIRDQFNVIKTTVSGSFNSLLAEGLPILEEFVDKTLLLINNTFVPAFKAASATVGFFSDALQGLGLVTQNPDDELRRLAQSVGISNVQFEKLYDTFDQGNPLWNSLLDFNRDLPERIEYQRQRQAELTREYIKQYAALRQLEDAQLAHEGGLIGETSASERAAQAARVRVAEYDRIRQANAQAEVTTRMFTGALFDEVGAANAAVAANNALAQSVDNVANAQRRYTLARGDILQARVGLAQTRAHAVSQSFNDPVQVASTVATAVAEGISGTMEEAVARAMGRVVQADFPVSMAEAIEAATLDWNMRQTNEGTLDLLRMGDTHLQQVLDNAREQYRAQVDLQAWWDRTTALQEAARERRAREAARQRQEIINGVRARQEALAQGFTSLSSSGVDSILQRAAGYGYTGNNLLAATRANQLGQRLQRQGVQNIQIQVIQDDTGQWVARQVNNGRADGSID